MKLLVSGKRSDTHDDQLSATFSYDSTEEMAQELPSTSVSRYIEKLKPKSGAPVGLLPPAVRWVSPDRNMVLFERPPTVQFVEIAQDRRDEITDNSSKISFSIPVPWTCYLCFFNSDYDPIKVKVFARNKPLSSYDDPLFMLPMFNFYNNASLCNAIWNDFYDGVSTLAMGIDRAYNMVWNSGFNYDLSDAIHLANNANTFSEFWGNYDGSSNGTKSLRFHGDLLLDFLEYWSTRPFKEVLSQSWPLVGHTTGSYRPVEMTVRTALAMTSSEVAGEFGSGVETFILEMMNAFYS